MKLFKIKKNERKKIHTSKTLLLIFIAALVLIYAFIFIIPNSVSRFALVPEKIPRESWRFLTYPFVHLNSDHLIKNLIALSLVALIIAELKTKFADFSLIYLFSGFLAIIPLWLALQFTALGASVAIYGAFGLICFEATKINIKAFYVWLSIVGILLFEAFILFASGSSSGFVLTQTSSHFSGLLFGAAFLLCLNKTKTFVSRKKNFCLRKEETK